MKRERREDQQQYDEEDDDDHEGVDKVVKRIRKNMWTMVLASALA